MSSMSVSIPKDVEEMMSEFKGIDWAGVARQAISNKAKQLAFMKYFASESELTEEDTLELGNKVNESVSKRYKKLI